MGLQRHVGLDRLELDLIGIYSNSADIFIIHNRTCYAYLAVDTAFVSLRSNCLDLSKYKLGWLI